MVIIHKDPQFNKSTIKIFITELTPHKPEIVRNWVRRSKMSPTKVAPCRSSIMCIRPNVTDVDTYEKLAYVIFRNVGYGVFELSMWNIYNKNRHFKHNFVCIRERCKYYQNGKCRYYSRHKMGDSCKLNRKYSPAWNRRATVELIPASNELGYNYHFDKKTDKMYLFRKWFWKGKSL